MSDWRKPDSATPGEASIARAMSTISGRWTVQDACPSGASSVAYCMASELAAIRFILAARGRLKASG
jgi:hypothetical protein